MRKIKWEMILWIGVALVFQPPQSLWAKSASPATAQTIPQEDPAAPALILGAPLYSVDEYLAAGGPLNVTVAGPSPLYFFPQVIPLGATSALRSGGYYEYFAPAPYGLIGQHEEPPVFEARDAVLFGN